MIYHSKECKIREYPTCTDGCHSRQAELRPREHVVVIDGYTYRPSDVELAAVTSVLRGETYEQWQAKQCISALSDNTVASETVGQPTEHLTYYPPRPLTPMITHDRFMREVDTVARLGRTLYRHSVLAYPHFKLWHLVFDGTWLCRCWRSKEMNNSH